jgi:hypothetical protein
VKSLSSAVTGVPSGQAYRLVTYPFSPGQAPRLCLQLAVDALGRAVEGDEPLALDGGQPGDGLGGLCDLLVDAAQGAPGPVGLVTAG